MKQRFVTFYSPGTFVSETTAKPVDSWNVKRAVEMSREIVERYEARPYAFQFSIRERADDELDSRVTERSPMYYLGGKVLTLAEVKARNDPKDSILISNMECNGHDRIVECHSPYKTAHPLNPSDVVLEVEDVQHTSANAPS